MLTTEYGKRVIALFKSGKATPAQWAELVEAVLCASENGVCNVAAIHEAIGFEAAQAADEAETVEHYAQYCRAQAVLA